MVTNKIRKLVEELHQNKQIDTYIIQGAIFHKTCDFFLECISIEINKFIDRFARDLANSRLETIVKINQRRPHKFLYSSIKMENIFLCRRCCNQRSCRFITPMDLLEKVSQKEIVELQSN